MQLGDSFALVDVTLVDCAGPEPREYTVVVVEGGDITDVLSLAEYRRREGVQEADLQGCFVLPGLIDAHVHLAGGRATIEDQELGAIAEPRLLPAIRSVAEAQALLRGFTAVRDISWNGLYLKRVFSEGSLPGPRVSACGPGLSRTGGHGDCYQYEEGYVTRNHVWAVLADGPDEVRKWARRILREGADQIKLWASGGDNWANDLSADQHFSLEEMQVAVDDARRQTGTMVCAHAESRGAIHAALVAGVDTIEHGGALDEELCELMVARGAILVPTLYLMTRWFEEFAGSAGRPVKVCARRCSCTVTSTISGRCRVPPPGRGHLRQHPLRAPEGCQGRPRLRHRVHAADPLRREQRPRAPHARRPRHDAARGHHRPHRDRGRGAGHGAPHRDGRGGKGRRPARADRGPDRRRPGPLRSRQHPLVISHGRLAVEEGRLAW